METKSPNRHKYKLLLICCKYKERETFPAIFVSLSTPNLQCSPQYIQVWDAARCVFSGD